MANRLRERLAGRLPALSVGAISADLLHLGDSIALLERSGVGLLHFDLMDGQFVPALTVGPAFVKAARTTMLKDVHLMAQDPLPLVAECAAAGAEIITVHPESCAHPHRVLQAIAELKCASDPNRPVARGVALNPSTPVAALEPFLDEIDMVVLVAVNPGFAGQKYIASTGPRLAQARALAGTRDLLFCADGGVTLQNIGRIAGLRPDIVVAGSAVFAGDPAENVRALQGALRTKVTTA